MNVNILRIFLPSLFMTAYCLSVSAATFTFTGAIDNNFNNVGNWDDGLGGQPATMAGTLADDLIVNGFTVSAGTGFGIGSGGSLTLTNSILDFNPSTNVTFFTGSEAFITDSTVNLLNNASQMSFNSGSSASLDGATLNIGDDMFFRGTISIIDSSITSRGDDIEFQSTAVITTASGNYFETVDPAQIISLDVDATFSTSTFVSGRFSIQNDIDIVIVDSDVQLNGDIEDAFNSRSTGTLTLQGTTTLRADQIDEGVELYLEDSSSANFIDDDAEGEWIGAATIGDLKPSLVVLSSLNASVSFTGPQGASNDATQIINGLVGPAATYANFPNLFSPSNWDGQSDVTISLVPEPSSILLLMVMACSLCTRRI